MQHLGLTATELGVYGDTLATSYGSSVEVRLLTMDGDLTGVQPAVNSGQVDVDADADVTRSASLEFNDPAHSLQLDSDSATDSGIYFNRMVQIRYAVPVPGIGDVWCSIFTGPIIKLDRTGDTVSVEAQGKESLARQGVQTRTFRRHKNAVDTIHDILHDSCGETEFAFPSLPARLPRHVVVGQQEATWPWLVCKQIAHSLGLHLFYDGRGVCVLRDEPGQPVFTLHTGEGSNITGIVEVSHDKSQVFNRVKVIGSKPAHSATAYLTNSPMSPTALARNGVPQFLSLPDVSNPQIRSKAAALKAGLRIIERYRTLTFGNTLNALPIPHLEELDLLRIVTDEYVGTERLRQLSFPLGGGEMTVGYNDVVSVARAPRKP